jgi:hypothetical protein
VQRGAVLLPLQFFFFLGFLDPVALRALEAVIRSEGNDRTPVSLSVCGLAREVAMPRHRPTG